MPTSRDQDDAASREQRRMAREPNHDKHRATIASGHRAGARRRGQQGSRHGQRRVESLSPARSRRQWPLRGRRAFVGRVHAGRSIGVRGPGLDRRGREAPGRDHAGVRGQRGLDPHRRAHPGSACRGPAPGPHRALRGPRTLHLALGVPRCGRRGGRKHRSATRRGDCS
jgi:hypothetical protein